MCTRDRSAKSHKGNGIDGVLQEDEAAQVTCHITNDSSTDADHGDGNDEAGVAIGNAWHDSKWDKNVLKCGALNLFGMLVTNHLNMHNHIILLMVSKSIHDYGQNIGRILQMSPMPL